MFGKAFRWSFKWAWKVVEESWLECQDRAEKNLKIENEFHFPNKIKKWEDFKEKEN